MGINGLSCLLTGAAGWIAGPGRQNALGATKAIKQDEDLDPKGTPLVRGWVQVGGEEAGFA